MFGVSEKLPRKGEGKRKAPVLLPSIAVKRQRADVLGNYVTISSEIHTSIIFWIHNSYTTFKLQYPSMVIQHTRAHQGSDQFIGSDYQFNSIQHELNWNLMILNWNWIGIRKPNMLELINSFSMPLLVLHGRFFSWHNMKRATLTAEIPLAT